jgi:Zn-dependent metalloprotease
MRLLVLLVPTDLVGGSAAFEALLSVQRNPDRRASGSPREIATRFVAQVAPSFGLSPATWQSLSVVKEYRTDHNGVVHVVFRQQYGGLEVAYSDFVVNVDSRGRVINAGGSLFAAPKRNMSQPSERSLAASIRAAMEWADPAAQSVPNTTEVQGTGKQRRFQLADGSGEVRGRALWYPMEDKLVPAWQFSVTDSTGVPQAATVDSESQAVLEARPLMYLQAPPPPRGWSSRVRVLSRTRAPVF